jgi:hypothetical protein
MVENAIFLVRMAMTEGHAMYANRFQHSKYQIKMVRCCPFSDVMNIHKSQLS